MTMRLVWQVGDWPVYMNLLYDHMSQGSDQLADVTFITVQRTGNPLNTRILSLDR